jgi:isopenicillin N synthase-like dioxygenase
MWEYIFGKKKIDLPEKLNCQKILEKDKETMEFLIESLKTKGFVVISMDEKQTELMKDYRKKCEEFFDKDESYKVKYAPRTDEIVKRKNIGWIKVKGLKEFLKVKRSDIDTGNFPDQPEKFDESYKSIELLFRSKKKN